jgi:uroporphyrin-3 C-methyltransferase
VSDAAAPIPTPEQAAAPVAAGVGAAPPAVAGVGAAPPAVAGVGAAAALVIAYGRWIAAGAVLLAVLSTAAVVFAWNTQQRLKTLEAELVKRQQDASGESSEARLAARQAQELSRESAGKLSLLEARVAETSLQRSQLEELIQSMARSRDENVLADVDAAIRVAQQQAAITGSAEPVVSVLRQADERLARYNQPRLERVRRAIAQDLDRARGAAVSDITTLTIRLDEVIRQVDDLPLLSQADKRAAVRPAPAPAASAPSAARAPASEAASAPLSSGFAEHWQSFADKLWHEVRGLVRVTRIDQPEAMLIAPEQTFFLRENLKLRLLNARLALLSRQFDTAQSDLRDALTALERYFDRNQRRTALAIEAVRLVSTQARQIAVPRPEATLAAIATAAAAAGR